MSQPISLSEVAELAAQLPPEERRQLAARLLAELSALPPLVVTPGRSWLEIRGSAPYPALGEDAQAWVTRTRREDTEHRERQLRRDEETLPPPPGPPPQSTRVERTAGMMGFHGTAEDADYFALSPELDPQEGD